MSNGVNNIPGSNQLWKGKAPGSIEFNTLLNLLPAPVIVIDPRNDSILAANGEFLKLTAYSVADLSKLEVSALFPEISRYYFIQLEEHFTLLKRYNRENMEVIAKGSPLDPHSSRILVTVLPYDSRVKKQETAGKLQSSLQVLGEMFSQVSNSNLPDALNRLLELSTFLVPSKIQCVYQMDNQLSQFVKVVSIEPELSIFPAATPNIKFEETRFDLWVPGKRVTNDFQRIGRVANLPYVGIFPLSLNNTILGLYIIADIDIPPGGELDILGSIISRGLESILYHFEIIQNLQDSLHQHIRSLTIRDTAINNASEGVILVRNDLTIEELNPSAEFMLGYASREVVGVPVENILIGTDALVPALKGALSGVPMHNLGNVSLHRRDGQSFLGHLQTLPVMQNDGLQSIIILLRDESENEMIRVKTQQLEQRALLGELMAIMAHEVRNPVNNISTGLQLLAMNRPQEDSNQDLIQRMQQDCGRLAHLVESTLTFSKPLEYRLVPADLTGLFRRMVERYRPRFTKANIKAYIQVEPDVRQVIGDLRALEQVFTNLVNNSIQAMTEGGVLAIQMMNKVSQPDNPEVEITVSDTGPGIPDEIKAHMFEPFVTNNPQGTGLGLAITKRIVLAHKGSINVTSFPGGTVFHVTLPAQKSNGGN